MAVVLVDDWQVKPGDGEKIVALLQTPTQWQPPQGTPRPLGGRAYSPSPTRFVLMLEWNNRAEADQWYKVFWTDPVGQELRRKLEELIVSRHDEEYWPVLEAWGLELWGWR
jgi:hypothetical protein